MSETSPLLSLHGAVAEPESAAGAKPIASPQRARVAVLGASGYSGLEFLRLALAHPGLEIAVLVSREHAGQAAHSLAPGFDERKLSLPPIVDPAALPAILQAGGADTVIACWPHGAFRAWRAEHPEIDRVPRIVDLSGDHRDGAGGFVYGLPEAGRGPIQAATRIANPGCYATAALLSLLPAWERRQAAGPACVSALSGASGAGRAPQTRTSFVELAESAAAYKAGTEHAHVAEIARAATRAAGAPMEVAFTPQIVAMSRGILLTAYLPLADAWTPQEAHATYAGRYAGEPFIRLLPPDHWPETGAVRGTNRCDLSVTTLFGGRTLLAVAAIDNLVKGAAGQAIQNLNLLLGWPETTGLPAHGSAW